MIKKILKSLISFAAIYGLTITCAIMYETNFMYNYKGSSVVMLRAWQSGGTGFRVEAPSGKTFILTNAHVCGNEKSLAAHYGDKEKEIKVIEKYKEHDLCLLEDIEDIPALDVADSLDSHERLWLIGHPALRQLTLESGHFVGNTNINLWTRCSQKEIKEQLKKYEEIKDLDGLLKVMKLSSGYCEKRTNANYINNISYGGNSGSPVLNKWGNVSGVLFAGYRGQPTASYMVPLHHIHKFLADK